MDDKPTGCSCDPVSQDDACPVHGFAEGDRVKWARVEDALPKPAPDEPYHSVPVIAWVRGWSYNVVVACYVFRPAHRGHLDKAGWHPWFETTWKMQPDITHWMPLPAPPDLLQSPPGE